MPDLTQLPTAQSGFEKFKSLLTADLRADVDWENGKEAVHFEIRRRYFLTLLFTPIAKVYMWDTSAKIKLYDNAYLDRIKVFATKFESKDPRRIEIEMWK